MRERALARIAADSMQKGTRVTSADYSECALARGELHGRRLLKHGLAAQSLVSPYDVHANDIADIVRVHHRYQVSDVVDVNAPQLNDDIARLNPGDGGLAVDFLNRGDNRVIKTCYGITSCTTVMFTRR